MKLKIFLLILIISIITVFYFTPNNHNDIYKINPKISEKKHKISTSKIDLEIKLKTQNLAKEISTQLPLEHNLKHIKISKDTWLNATIKRENNLKISVKNNALLIAFGINIKGKIEYKKYFIKAKSKFHIKAKISAMVDIEVDKNWKLDAKSIHLSIKMNKATTSLYGIKIPIKSLLKKEIKKKIPQLDYIIKRAINKISIKTQMSKIWEEMNILHKIKNREVWFHFAPENIIFDKKYENNNILSLYPSIIGKAMIITDKNDIKEHTSLPLPTLQKNKTNDNKFYIKLPIKLNYKKLSIELMKKLNKKEMEINGFKIAIEAIKFIPSNNDIIIVINFHSHFIIDLFDTKGTLVFKGKPKYDIKTHKLMIEKLAYHLDIDEKIISLASLLWHNNFKDKIEKVLIHEINQSNKLIHKYKDIINQKIDLIQINKEISLNGKIEILELDDIYLTHLDIVIILNMIGEMNLSYNPILERDKEIK